MNDDVQSPDTPSDELAAVNAVLDGTATSDQRALVDASPELTEQLQQFHADRDQLRSVPASAAARESAIAAALAAFDELHPGTASAPSATPAHPANVVSLDSRRRWYRVVAGAAAALLVVVVGAAAIGSLGNSSDDDTATSATAAKAQDAAGSAPAPMIENAPAAGDASDSATEMAQTADTTAPDATSAPAATEAPAGSPPGPTIGFIPGGGAGVTPDVTDEQQLQSYAANAARIDDASKDPCVPAGDDDLGHVTYQDTPAVLGRHPDDDMLTVYAVDDCRVLKTLAT